MDLVLAPMADHAYVVELVDLVHRDLVGPFQVAASFVVLHPAEDPSSFEDHDFVVNVEDVEGVGDAVDEVALVADVDVGYEDVGSDSVAEPEQVASYTVIQID